MLSVTTSEQGSDQSSCIWFKELEQGIWKMEGKEGQM